MSIPKELIALPQWVVAYPVNKEPLNPVTMQPASVTDPSSWVTYEQAANSKRDNSLLELGFVLTPECELVCLDLDTYKATGDQTTLELHKHISKYFNGTYQERSLNGGCHIIAKGKWNVGNRDSKQFVEVYAKGRYLLFTGNGNDLPIADCQPHLDELAKRLNFNAPTNEAPPIPDQPETQTDDQIIKSCKQATTGDKFIGLWEVNHLNSNGEWIPFKSYPSQSEADQALCNFLAFRTDNKSQCGRLFRKSQLGKREKAKRWDYLFHAKWGIVTKAFDQKMPTIDLSASDPTQKQQQPQTTSIAEVVFMDATNVDPENIVWLWKGYLPLGKFALIAGPANVGKSTLSFWMAAIVSSGGTWPDGTQCEQGHVLIWTSEDTLADTVIPRLIAMGAELKNISIIQSAVDATGRRQRFDPSRDMSKLQNVLVNFPGRVKLIIIDPAISTVQGDSNATGNVRRELEVLPALAEAGGCCVLGLVHFKKYSEGHSLQDRVIGSMSFHALPRVILAVGKDRETQQRVLCHAKKNIAKDSGGGYAFTIVGTEFDFKGKTIETSKIEMGEVLEGTGEEIYESVEHFEEQKQSAHKNKQTKLEFARDVAVGLLTDGRSIPVKEFDELAKNRGITERTWTLAKKELGIVSGPLAMNQPWVVRLPPHSLWLFKPKESNK